MNSSTPHGRGPGLVQPNKHREGRQWWVDRRWSGKRRGGGSAGGSPRMGCRERVMYHVWAVVRPLHVCVWTPFSNDQIFLDFLFRILWKERWYRLALAKCWINANFYWTTLCFFVIDVLIYVSPFVLFKIYSSKSISYVWNLFSDKINHKNNIMIFYF
jgi:hypothetical protein